MRKAALVALWALVVSAGLVGEHARAQPRPDGLYVRAGGRRMPAPRAQALASIANDNGQYDFSVTYRMRACPSNVVLLVGGALAPAPSTSIGNGRCTYDFRVARATADRVALALGVPRQDRVPVAERVSGRFATARAAYARGAPIEIRLTITNPADAPPVQREVGCMRFSFVVFRDGQRMAELHAGAEACPVGFVPLAPGASGEDVVDVRRWANIDAAGHYRFECRYDTRFAPAGAEIFAQPLGASARVWDRTFTGNVDVDVR